MIAFGCATTSESEYRAFAEPSIRRLAERGSLVMRRHGYDSIQEPYNEMLARAGERDDLEAVVLLHQDLSIEDPFFLGKLRSLLAASDDVAVIGAVGARGVDSLAWWDGEESHGHVDVPAMVPGGTRLDFSRGAHEVDAVDGLLLVLSAWAARELRFDADLSGPLDGYDTDICLQARAHGKRVVVGDFDVAHHVQVDFFDRERWARAAVALRRKWAPERVPRTL